MSKFHKNFLTFRTAKKFPVMAHNINCCRSQVYEVAFKILSLCLKDESKIEDLNVNVRFVEKCFTIKSGDDKSLEIVEKEQKEEQENPRRSRLEDIKEEPENVSRVRKSKRISDPSPRSLDKMQQCPSNDGDDEASENNEQRKRARSLSLRRQRCSSVLFEALYGESNESQTSRNDDGKDVQQEPPPLFGSMTVRFDAAPSCMADKIAKHCIKYEICNGCNLIATTSQQLSECFANSIRTQDFSAENVNMQLLLLTPKTAENGFMNVCIIVKKAEEVSNKKKSLMSN